MPQFPPTQNPVEPGAGLTFRQTSGDRSGAEALTFRSILFDTTEDGLREENVEAPTFCTDLNLDQIIRAIRVGREEYDLKPFFYTLLRDVGAVLYRQEIFQDLENEGLFESIHLFTQKMREVRACLTKVDSLYYKRQKERWFLDSAEIYCRAVDSLIHNLSRATLRSRGLHAFREYLANYARSNRFISLSRETKKLKDDLAAVKYCVFIKGSTVKVSKLGSEADYSTDVEKTFEKFNGEGAKDYRVKFPDLPNMNHVEARILELVAQLDPEVFLDLQEFYKENADYYDETIALFDRQIQFYVAYIEFMGQFERVGLRFCYPRMSDQPKEVHCYEGFDLALARKLILENSPVVCNDFHLAGKERIIVISGPNQSGKTTFARTFGQLHYLACLGCPIPGSKARLFLFDRLFTHFERQEDIKDLRGKLEDDLVRMHAILRKATSNSIVIMNEIFTSTALLDAVSLSKRLMEKLVHLDALCVWVTFIDELASFGEQTISMVGTVASENPTARTYKVLRRPADGLSYAVAIAERHGLTYSHLKERLKS